MRKKGLFITLEGPDGSGKTTQARLLIEYLKKAGLTVVHTREPGGEKVAEQIRQVLLSTKNQVTTSAEVFLYLAARCQNVQNVIMPALARGQTVICERFSDATWAYQGYGRGLDLKLLAAMNKLAAGGLEPDLTILLDIVSAQGLKRVVEAKGAKDAIEREGIEFHQRVRKGYLDLAKRNPKRIKKIRVNRSIDEIHRRVVRLVEKIIPKANGKYSGRNNRTPGNYHQIKSGY